MAKVPNKSDPGVKVTIYEDKTLRRGDAVMTTAGMRVFAGSNSFPYSESDFVAVSTKEGVSKDVAKTLIAMDRVSRQ